MEQEKTGKRPRYVFTHDDKIKIEALSAYLSIEQIADYFGIGRTTFYEMVKRDPSISEHYKRGRSHAISDVASSLVMKARDGDNTCMLFYLKTQAGWKEQTFIEHNINQADNTKPLNVTFNVKDAKDDIKITRHDDES